jgi:DNA-binding response OmpR family regulator
MRILLVEDNARLAEALADGLRKSGFAVDATGSIDGARRELAAVCYDLMILDLGLPDGDGRELVKSIRRCGDALPILLLTAKSAVVDRVDGLESGADDYVSKPVELEELAARCRALLRRPAVQGGMRLSCGDVSFDVTMREASVSGVRLELTRREAEVLEMLVRRGGHVVQRARLEASMYAADDAIQSNALEVCMSRLRKRLSDAGASSSIHTVRGVGYALMPESA